MKYIDEYRDAHLLKRLAESLHLRCTRPWRIMEICGGQTHAIARFGLEALLPEGLELLHGPGCPVCVTPIETIDKAIAISLRPEVIFCTFGDMLRVPGSRENLWSAKANGADVRVVYSPLAALEIAEQNPTREIVFLAVGFETTAPAHALAILRAKRQNVPNFSLLLSHFLVPPAMEALLSVDNRSIDGFLAAGHVCTVMGTSEYAPLAAHYRIPIVVTGFEPVDILQGLHMCVAQLEEGRTEVENQYSRSVRTAGNPSAQAWLAEVFEVVPRKWRGLGEIKASGLGLRSPYQAMDADRRFAVAALACDENPRCMSGLIMQGKKKPVDCPSFAADCRPETPLGAPMVSSEGACAAYYRYRPLAPQQRESQC